jgi:hypothetical protein
LTYDPNTPPRPAWEEKLREAATRIEDEVRRVATLLDEEVVPEVRRTSSVALRAASEKLAQLAQHLEDKARGDAGDPHQK